MSIPRPTATAYRRGLVAAVLTLIAGATLTAAAPPAATPAVPVAPEAKPATAPAADGKVLLFDGKGVDGWKFRNEKQARNWSACDGAVLDKANPGKLQGLHLPGPMAPLEQRVLLCKAVSSDILTAAEFADFDFHAEFMVPKGGNSGIYFRGLWEVQIFDSHGKKTIGPGDCGSLYGRRVATVNAANPPGEWNILDVTLKGFRITATLNGKVIHDDWDVRWTELSDAEHARLMEDRKRAGDADLVAKLKAEAAALRAEYEKLKGDAKAEPAAVTKAKAASDKANAAWSALSSAATAKIESEGGRHRRWAGEGPTTSGVDRKDRATGPILLQGDHGDVAFRNVWIRPLK